MDLALCPYCELPGLVTSVRAMAAGLEMTGKCRVCGYSIDSEYALVDSAGDLPGEFSRSLEMTAAD